MSAGQQDQDAKRKIVEGMDEAGKHPEPTSGAGKPGGSGKIDKTGEMTEGMSEAGKRPKASVEDQAEGHPS